MAERTGIEWADSTWNPLVGCTKVSPGCDHCYAETLVNRFAGRNKAFPNRFDVVTMRDERMLRLPLSADWRKPKRIFVNSLSDLFHADVPDEFIARVFAVMVMSEHHTFQLLTKRHARMRSLLNSAEFGDFLDRAIVDIGGSEYEDFLYPWPLPNVWPGVSVEDQHWADIRIPALLDTPAAVRWISAEPLLGPVDLRHWLTCTRCGGRHIFGSCSHLMGSALLAVRTSNSRTSPAPGLDWVVVGGESGTGARPMHPQWARDLRDQCAAAGVPFLFKQAGSVLAREWGCSDRKGGDAAEWPLPLPREYPA